MPPQNGIVLYNVCMSNLYALFPGTIPAYKEIESAVSHQFIVTQVDKIEALSKFREEKGVVILGDTPERAASFVTMIRKVAPRLCPVVVLDEKDKDNIPETLANLSDVLISPNHPREIQCRINRALHLSELRYLIDTSAQLDEATQLYTYQYFLKRLGEEMALSKRHLSPVTCVIISISYYEIYMDSYGFSFVTNIMQQVSRMIRDHVRQEDIVARLGDSEVGLLLPHSTEKGALALMNRLIKYVEKIPVHIGDQVEHLSLTVGIAGYPTSDQEEMDPDTLIRYTRHALHSARCSESKKIQLFSEMKPFVG